MTEKYIEFSGTFHLTEGEVTEDTNDAFMDLVVEQVEKVGGQLFMFSEVKEELFDDDEDMLESLKRSLSDLTEWDIQDGN